MPASHLSVICSLSAVCITTIKFVVPAWRIYYEYTRNPKSIRELKLWLDTGMSAIFAILSWLLLVFSLVRLDNGLQILLSLAGGLLIVYEGGYLSLYCGDCPPRWLRWALLMFFIAAIISIVIALSVGYTKASKIMLLSLFLAEYLVIFVVYSVTFFRGILSHNVRSLFLWNMGLCCMAWAGALGSLVAYLKGRLDFITFLWIDNAAAIVWVVWLLWNQWTALQKARSLKEGSDEENSVLQQDDLPRQGSATQLVAPSAVHMRDSNRKG